jgi:hypothetical protein
MNANIFTMMEGVEQKTKAITIFRNNDRSE